MGRFLTNTFLISSVILIIITFSVGLVYLEQGIEHGWNRVVKLGNDVKVEHVEAIVLDKKHIPERRDMIQTNPPIFKKTPAKYKIQLKHEDTIRII